jgi:hypothetical protein
MMQRRRCNPHNTSSYEYVERLGGFCGLLGLASVCTVGRATVGHTRCPSASILALCVSHAVQCCMLRVVYPPSIVGVLLVMCPQLMVKL